MRFGLASGSATRKPWFFYLSELDVFLYVTYIDFNSSLFLFSSNLGLCIDP